MFPGEDRALTALAFLRPLTAAHAEDLAEHAVFDVDQRTRSTDAEATRGLSRDEDIERPSDTDFIPIVPGVALRAGRDVLPWLAREGAVGDTEIGRAHV